MDEFQRTDSAIIRCLLGWLVALIKRGRFLFYLLDQIENKVQRLNLVKDIDMFFRIFNSNSLRFTNRDVSTEDSPIDYFNDQILKIN